MSGTSKRFLSFGIGAALLAVSFVAGYAGGKREGTSPALRQESPAAPPHELLNAALWQHTAAEYRAATWQAYHLARESLDRALADLSWSASLEQAPDFTKLPPAVITDVDETVLDSTEYEARVVREYGEYTPDSFNRWCEELRSGVVPGAREFFTYARKKGVQVFFTTNRPDAVREATRKNLEKWGFPLDLAVETVLANDGTTTSERRRKVAARYRILLEVGDNLDDFVAEAKGTPGQRFALAEKYRDYWGTRWVILPNAMYGFWEAAVYGFDYGLPRAEKLRKKVEALGRLPR
jgi:acid phosphatase